MRKTYLVESFINCFKDRFDEHGIIELNADLSRAIYLCEDTGMFHTDNNPLFALAYVIAETLNSDIKEDRDIMEIFSENVINYLGEGNELLELNTSLLYLLLCIPEGSEINKPLIRLSMCIGIASKDYIIFMVENKIKKGTNIIK